MVTAQTSELLRRPERHPLRVLVVDDEPMIGTLIVRQLPACHVTVERRARAALARIDSGETFDRILCDIVMPEMGGREFFECIERQHPHLLDNLAFMSGGALMDLDHQWLLNLTRPLLRKPFTREQLIELLDDLPWQPEREI